MPLLVKKAEGIDGRVTLPEIGALIGYFTNWKIWTPKPDGDDYNFQAHLGWINPRLWQLKKEDGSEYERLIVIDVGKEKKYRLVQGNGTSAEIVGQQLNMEHVSLAPYEGR